MKKGAIRSVLQTKEQANANKRNGLSACHQGLFHCKTINLIAPNLKVLVLLKQNIQLFFFLKNNTFAINYSALGYILVWPPFLNQALHQYVKQKVGSVFFLRFKTSFHTINVHFKFTNYLQQPLFREKLGKKAQTLSKIILVHLNNLCLSRFDQS